MVSVDEAEVTVNHSDWAEDFADVEVVVEDEVFKEHSGAMVISSPVFSAMLRSSMQEGKTKRITLVKKLKEEYRLFRPFMLPRCINAESQQVSVKNVDVLLPWFHEYQMA